MLPTTVTSQLNSAVGMVFTPGTSEEMGRAETTAEVQGGT